MILQENSGEFMRKYDLYCEECLKENKEIDKCSNGDERVIRNELKKECIKTIDLISNKLEETFQELFINKMVLCIKKYFEFSEIEITKALREDAKNHEDGLVNNFRNKGISFFDQLVKSRSNTPIENSSTEQFWEENAPNDPNLQQLEHSSKDKFENINQDEKKKRSFLSRIFFNRKKKISGLDKVPNEIRDDFNKFTDTLKKQSNHEIESYHSYINNFLESEQKLCKLVCLN